MANKIFLMGRLTRDPEVRYINDNKIARYSLAVDRRFKKEGAPDADFFNCTVFGKGAEFAEKYLKKGIKILMCGHIISGKYEKDGQTIYTQTVIVDRHEFVESRKAAEEH